MAEDGSTFWSPPRLVICVVLLAFFLRLWAAWQLPVDYDEPVYLQTGFDYARLIQAGDWQAVIDYPESREHPPLVKLLYGSVILALGEKATWENALLACRFVSAVFGTLGVLLVTLTDPLAGGLLAVQTYAVKYTAQAYLEALPLFAALASILALRRWRGDSLRQRWFWLSALALGLTAAGKYSYLPALPVILYIAILEKKASWKGIAIYLGMAAITFWALDPSLWHAPLTRFADSIFFHAEYSQGLHVQEIGYPWYQPFIWIFTSSPADWHPNVFFYFGFDGFISVLAVAGIKSEWKERRWLVVWLAFGVLFLLLWPTKWPQYTLAVVPAFCLAAATAARRAYRWLKEQETYWGWLNIMLLRPPRGFFIGIVSLIVLLTIAGIANAVSIGVNRIGWTHITADTSPLPSNTIYDIIRHPDGRMILATENGAAIWSTPANKWQVLTPLNSPLPHERVLTVMVAKDGSLWFGTQGGLAHFDESQWSVYRAADFGLAGEQVQALAEGNNGQIWIGGATGAAVFDGQNWTPFTQATSGLADDAVFSLAVAPQAGGDWVWFGTLTGVSRLDTFTGEWVTFTGQNFDANWGGVADLMMDGTGQLWAATLGGGLGRWDGKSWSFYRVSNSGIPFNTVQEVAEVDSVFWVGTAIPNSAGGVLARFDGKEWRRYTPNLSGFSGGEVLSIAQDSTGRLWFGTRTSGVDIYSPKR